MTSAAHLPDIYDQHDKAFKDVQGYVVTDRTGMRIATVAFKRGDAITCYLHILGLQMTKGRAGGGGYDRFSAAAYDAITKTKITDGARPEEKNLVDKFKAALLEGAGGSHWDYALRNAGFNVLQAI